MHPTQANRPDHELRPPGSPLVVQPEVAPVRPQQVIRPEGLGQVPPQLRLLAGRARQVQQEQREQQQVLSDRHRGGRGGEARKMADWRTSLWQQSILLPKPNLATLGHKFLAGVQQFQTWLLLWPTAPPGSPELTREIQL